METLPDVAARLKAVEDRLNADPAHEYPPVLKIDELSKLLDYSERTIRRRVKADPKGFPQPLRLHRNGTGFRWELAAILRWVAAAGPRWREKTA